MGEREKFEIIAAKEGLELRRITEYESERMMIDAGDYYSIETRRAWNLWQAAREGVEVPEGLIKRVKAAEKRMIDGTALRRIPADPTDMDLILAEVLAFLEGREPPFWIKAAPQPPKGQSDE